MNKVTTLLAAVGLSACSTAYDPQEIEAVRDYVAAAQLEQVDEIRFFSQFHYNYVNDHFVTVSTRRGDYLVEFARRCSDLTHTDFRPEMVDRRDSSNQLRAKFDTIRGCRIGKIYEINEMQRRELHDLGDAPGEEVYLPDDKES